MTHIPYILNYVLVIACGILLLSYRSKLQKNITYIVVALILVVFSSLRHYVGPDYSNYVEAYRTVVLYDLSQSLDYQFFVYLSKIGAYFSESKGYIFVLFVYALVTVYYFVKAIMATSINPLVSLLIFLSIGFYLDSFDRVRQLASVAILFYAYINVNQGDVKKGIIYIVAASFAHISSLICLPILLIRRVRVNNVFLSILLILFVVAGYFGFFVNVLIEALSKLPFYTYSMNTDFIHTLFVQNSGLLYYSKIIFVAIVIAINKKQHYVNIWLFIAGVVMAIGGGNILFYRLAMCFLSPIILTPNFLKSRLSPPLYLLANLLIVIYCLVVYMFESQRNKFEYITWL
ncbi:EpsG family protein [Vibrio cholerae]|nr:EpsG family protein [Vibrio cholerae]ELH5114982.1 EpsG family protein [Vibrio cholerae]